MSDSYEPQFLWSSKSGIVRVMTVSCRGDGNFKGQDREEQLSGFSPFRSSLWTETGAIKQNQISSIRQRNLQLLDAYSVTYKAAYHIVFNKKRISQLVLLPLGSRTTILCKLSNSGRINWTKFSSMLDLQACSHLLGDFVTLVPSVGGNPNDQN